MTLLNHPAVAKIFQKRSSSVYQHLRRIGGGCPADLDFTLQDFRRMVAPYIGRLCPYCGTKLQASNFTADHGLSVKAGGQSNRGNLIICCMRCNKAKGEIPYKDFMALCKYLQEAMPEWKSKILTRMAQGSSFVIGAQRRAMAAK